MCKRGWEIQQDFSATSVKSEVKIPADKMLEIALQSYRTALRLKAAKHSVILYRVKDKKYLSSEYYGDSLLNILNYCLIARASEFCRMRYAYPAYMIMI